MKYREILKESQKMKPFEVGEVLNIGDDLNAIPCAFFGTYVVIKPFTSDVIQNPSKGMMYDTLKYLEDNGYVAPVKTRYFTYDAGLGYVADFHDKDGAVLSIKDSEKND